MSELKAIDDLYEQRIRNWSDPYINFLKRKRCEAMARWCGSEVFVSDYEKDEPRMRWWIKWHTRWLKIAEKFKEAK